MVNKSTTTNHEYHGRPLNQNILKYGNNSTLKIYIYLTQWAHFVEKLCDRTGAFGPKVVRHLVKLCDIFHSRTGR